MNLDHIAKLTGVSRATVSRVVNNNPRVKAETRERVMEVIRNVNYQPNIAARGLAAGRTGILGLVIPLGVSALFTDPYFPLLIQSISAACNAREHSVMLWLADPDYERRTIRQIMQNGLIDGVIVAAMLMDDPLVQSLIESSLPFVLIGRHPTNDQVSYVDIDNQASSREAVAHLLRLGHRRVGTITGPQNTVVSLDRLRGYESALRDRGLRVEDDLVVESDFTEAGGYAAMQRLMPHQPEAVYIASDAMAAGALRALHEAGRRVPEDVAVVSFDDMPFAARTDPPLTTVRQPIGRAGAVSVETLIDLIENRAAGPRRVVLPAELVIRRSCGAFQQRPENSAA